jgi:hypothetical protein
MQTHERFQMDQAAFSPSGSLVALAVKEGNYLEVLDVRSGQRVHEVLLPKFSSFAGPSLAWSLDETRFYHVDSSPILLSRSRSSQT